MICKACNYEYKYDYCDSTAIKGDEEFIKINGYFTRDLRYEYASETVQVYLYGCPKCGSVVINLEI
jgi:ABC-type ATPase with predicted acetyltransferase domain